MPRNLLLKAPRGQQIAGWVTADERRDVEAAARANGFRSVSELMRVMGLLFVREVRVRDLVVRERGKAA